MKYRYCSLVFLLCIAQYGQSQQTLVDTIVHDGLSRTFILYVPDSYIAGAPAPLVLNFHGYGSNALEQMFYGDFRPIADTAGFLIVHPQGTLDLLGNEHWNVGWGASSVDDVGFTSALIDSLSLMYSIDAERIYSTGMSNGGFISYKLACELSERIAAIASVTGSMNVNQTASCNPGHPMPVMEIHGTLDQTVQYDGSFLFAPIESVLEYWVDFNACDPAPIVENIVDTDQTDGSTVERYLYLNGTMGAEVEHYKIINGGHTWPGTVFDFGETNYDINASKEIWRFFSRYDINGLIGSVSLATNASDDRIRIYPNPARTTITIESRVDQAKRFVLSTIQGQPISTGVITPGVQSIPVMNFQYGMYILSLDDHVFKIIISE